MIQPTLPLVFVLPLVGNEERGRTTTSYDNCNERTFRWSLLKTALQVIEHFRDVLLAILKRHTLGKSRRERILTRSTVRFDRFIHFLTADPIAG